MTAEQARAQAATAEEERKAGGEQQTASEERKDEGTQRTSDGMRRVQEGMQRMPRLLLPRGGIPDMPTGTPGRVLWWGGLAALAAFEVVDWPVVALVGAGEWVAEQYAKSAARNQRADEWQADSQEPSHS